MRVSWAGMSTSLVMIAFALAALLYPWLPRQMPIHWDSTGNANGYLAKPFGPFGFPTMMAVIRLAFYAYPRLAFRAYEQTPLRGLMLFVELSSMALLFVVTVTAMLRALDLPIPWDRALTPALGIIVIVLGRLLTNVEQNPYVGICTPWTLASSEVWRQTHKLGARLFMGAGLIMLAAGAIGLDLWTIMIALVTAAAAPAIYSYFVYRQLHSRRSPRNGRT